MTIQDDFLKRERQALLALHFIPGVGPLIAKRLVEYCGSAQAVLTANRATLLSIPRIGKTLADSILEADLLQRAHEEQVSAMKRGVRILYADEADFPQRLKNYEDCPSVLYVQGPINLNVAKTVGIVGTRKATAYGKTMVKKLVHALVKHQPIIISGLAYGIDIHAHREALNAGIATLGVMGSGVDIIYPSEHRDTAYRMVEKGGGLAAENPLGTRPETFLFPARNRIIAALSDVLIVVETAAKGGSLITAKLANEYDKHVFAIPGAADSPQSIGCNNLIKSNLAHLLTEVSDIEHIAGWDSPIASHTAPRPAHLSLELSDFDEPERKLITLLKERSEGVSIDELIRQSAMNPGQLASTLLQFEIKDIVQSLPGKRYKLRGL